MKKRMSTIIGALVVLCLATSCFVGSTFAKYTSTVNGNADVEASVAKWSFDIGGVAANLADGTAENLTFSTGVVTNTEGTDTIAVDSGKVKMAPGSQGSFTLALTNTSDVTAKVVVTVTSVSLKINDTEVSDHPFKYSATGDDDYTEIDTGLVVYNGNIAHTAENEENVTIYWEWAFNGNDEVDTKIGIAQANGDTITWTVNVEVVLTQVD